MTHPTSQPHDQRDLVRQARIVLSRVITRDTLSRDALAEAVQLLEAVLAAILALERVNEKPIGRVHVDWRTTRKVLLEVKPDWKPSSGDEQNQDWDFAEAIIETYRFLIEYSECSGCKRRRHPKDFYRCWDCSAYLCEDCIKSHMGPLHIPHPKLIEQYEAEISALKNPTMLIRLTHTGDTG